MKIPFKLPKTKKELKELLVEHKKVVMISFFVISFFSLYLFSKVTSEVTKIVHHKDKISFESSRNIDTGKRVYKRKEQIISRKYGKIEKELKNLKEAIKNLEQVKQEKLSDKQLSNKVPQVDILPAPTNTNRNINFSPPPTNLQTSKISTQQKNTYTKVRRKRKVRKKVSGPSTLSFPVQKTAKQPKRSVKLPAGSYLKAKLLTGVEAAESKPRPVLLQADYFFVGPNKSKVDLSGCFIIAKSEGNLSIERVEMQATKISCVSKSGEMFERSLNGYVTDSKDTSFGVNGELKSKQGRVATMGFLSSVVEGVSNAIQKAQTTQSVGSNGSTSSMVSGDQGKYMMAGGASNAASRITNWYLKQAESLLPTIKIGSGQDVWIIVNETVDLPSWYFKKPKSNNKTNSGNQYLYMSRMNE